MQLTPELVHTIVEYSFYAFVILICGATIATAVMFLGKHSFTGENIGEIIKKSEIARIATIILIIVSASFLGLLGVIDGQAVVAILSGIAGYVLGDRGPRDRPRQTADPRA